MTLDSEKAGFFKGCIVTGNYSRERHWYQNWLEVYKKSSFHFYSWKKSNMWEFTSLFVANLNIKSIENVFVWCPKLYFMSQKFMKNCAYFGGLAWLSLVIWKLENNKVWKNLIEKSCTEHTDQFIICLNVFFKAYPSSSFYPCVYMK